MHPQTETTIESQMRAHAKAVRQRLSGHTLSKPVVVAPPKPEPVRIGVRPICNRPYRQKWREIVALSAERHGVSVCEVLGRGRSKSVLAARVEAMWLLRRYAKLSLPQIGERFGRDHSTVLQNLKKFGPEIAARFE